MTLLTFLVGRTAGYLDNPLRQDLWRAGTHMRRFTWCCRWSFYQDTINVFMVRHDAFTLWGQPRGPASGCFYPT